MSQQRKSIHLIEDEEKFEGGQEWFQPGREK